MSHVTSCAGRMSEMEISLVVGSDDDDEREGYENVMLSFSAHGTSVYDSSTSLFKFLLLQRRSMLQWTRILFLLPYDDVRSASSFAPSLLVLQHLTTTLVTLIPSSLPPVCLTNPHHSRPSPSAILTIKPRGFQRSRRDLTAYDDGICRVVKSTSPEPTSGQKPGMLIHVSGSSTRTFIPRHCQDTPPSNTY